MSHGFPSSAGNPSPSPQGPYNVTVVGIRLFLIAGAVVIRYYYKPDIRSWADEVAEELEELDEVEEEPEPIDEWEELDDLEDEPPPPKLKKRPKKKELKKVKKKKGPKKDRQIYLDCPRCGNNFNVNVSGKTVFSCPSCGLSGEIE